MFSGWVLAVGGDIPIMATSSWFYIKSKIFKSVLLFLFLELFYYFQEKME